MDHIKSIMPLIETAIAIRKAVTDAILNLPDNEKINRIDNKCFTINSSDLDKGITSANYYDFRYQYKIIASVLNLLPIEKTVDWLNTVIKQGSFKHNGVLIKLHPEVIEHLQSVIE